VGHGRQPHRGREEQGRDDQADNDGVPPVVCHRHGHLDQNRGKSSRAATPMTWATGSPGLTGLASGHRGRGHRPPGGYLRGILSYLPEAIVTVDCFHGVKLANSMVDDIRRRVQQESLGHRGRKDDPLFKTRRLMTRGWERLSDRQRDKLLRALDAGDPD
jgi:transposase